MAAMTNQAQSPAATKTSALAVWGLILLTSLAAWHFTVCFLPWYTGQRAEHFARRLDDLARLRDALADYHAKYGRYPANAGFAGAVDPKGETTGDWLPGLAGEFLPSLPRDPAGTSDPDKQYLYHGDGADYKIIVHGSGDCALARKNHPDMVDPARDCWAYGYWTPAAANW